jgi:hypothetical protein
VRCCGWVRCHRQREFWFSYAPRASAGPNVYHAGNNRHNHGSDQGPVKQAQKNRSPAEKRRTRRERGHDTDDRPAPLISRDWGRQRSWTPRLGSQTSRTLCHQTRARPAASPCIARSVHAFASELAGHRPRRPGHAHARAIIRRCSRACTASGSRRRSWPQVSAATRERPASRHPSA